MADGKNTFTGFKDGKPWQQGITGITGFLAQPGHGKTFLMAARFWPARRCVVYNTAGNYASVPGENKNILPGFLFLYCMNDLVHVLRQTGQGQPLKVCFTPVGDRKIPRREIFHDTCELLMDYKDVLFCIEEIWNFQRPSMLPDIQQQIFLQWRHYRMPIMWNAQQPQLVAQTLRSITTDVYVGRLEHELDLRAARECGLSEEMLSVLPSLPHRKFVHKFPDRTWKIEEA
jgi:hypothetical protein